jgi:hypothetical protein
MESGLGSAITSAGERGNSSRRIGSGSIRLGLDVNE